MMGEGCGIAYKGIHYNLIYFPSTSAFSLQCDGVKLNITTKDNYYDWKCDWIINVKFKNFIFDRTTPFEERLKRAITEGTEKVMEYDDIFIKQKACEKKCSIKIDESIKGVLNDN